MAHRPRGSRAPVDHLIRPVLRGDRAAQGLRAREARPRKELYKTVVRTAAFEAYTERYDQWFVRHDAAYLSELAAVRHLLPRRGLGVEIGVGTGRFAGFLDISIGLDPSVSMLRRSRNRGLTVVRGVAEALPFLDQTFDYCLMVTTICFVEDPKSTIREAHRALKPHGNLVIGFVDRESTLGQHYIARRTESVFYRDASFYSPSDVESLLVSAGFSDLSWVQTLFRASAQSTGIEETRPGYGEGSFVVVRAARGG